MISGSLMQRYWVDTVATPGAAQPDVHRDPHNTTGDRAQGERDQLAEAGAGGGWQPDAWTDEDQLAGLPGGNFRPGSDSHVATGSHKGSEGRGLDVRDDVDVVYAGEDLQGGRHTRVPFAFGLGGAAFGGLRRTGTLDPSSNPGGVDLGHDYRPAAWRHRQNLHFNAPTIRPIRWPSRTAERSSPYPGGRTSPYNPMANYSQGGGPSLPKLRRMIRPVGRSGEDFDAIDQVPAAAVLLDPGPIGGDWVR